MVSWPSDNYNGNTHAWKDGFYIETGPAGGGGGGRLNVTMPSYQYRDPHVKDKTVSRPSYH